MRGMASLSALGLLGQAGTGQMPLVLSVAFRPGGRRSSRARTSQLPPTTPSFTPFSLVPERLNK